MEKQSDKILLENIDSLMVGTGTVFHEISVDEENPDIVMHIWVKPMSFMDTQKVIKEFVSIEQSGEVSVDLSSYWKYMFLNCIDRTEPKLSKTQLMALKPEIARKITRILPQPEDLVAGPLEDGLSE
tara:strand:- start:16177 stop:16557 length:381 start_codon:yes stop_codon:yes gene_type:complete